MLRACARRVVLVVHDHVLFLHALMYSFLFFWDQRLVLDHLCTPHPGLSQSEEKRAPFLYKEEGRSKEHIRENVGKRRRSLHRLNEV